MDCFSQLVAYGYSAVAQNVAATTGATNDLSPSNKLSELIAIARAQRKPMRCSCFNGEKFAQSAILLLEENADGSEEEDESDSRREQDHDSLQANIEHDQASARGFDPDAVNTARKTL